MKEAKSYDEVLQLLAKQIDFQSGEDLYKIEQQKLLDQQFKNMRQQLVTDQILMQALIDIRQKLPQKIYNKVIQRIAVAQNQRIIQGTDLNNFQSEDDKENQQKVKSQIEYEVIPELEQYLHSISKQINKALTLQQEDSDNKSLTDLFQQVQSETEALKTKIDVLKADKQKKKWEIQDLDIQIRDFIEKIGRGFILNSASTYQQEQVHSLETHLNELVLKEEEQKAAFNQQFVNQEQSQAQQKVKMILEKRIQDMTLQKTQLHQKVIKYSENEQDFKMLAVDYLQLKAYKEKLDEDLKRNAYGELAHGDNIERHVFTLVDYCKSHNVIQVAAGNEHSIILTDNGDVYSSGYNEMGNTLSSSSNAMTQNNSINSSKTGHLKIIEKLRGKNIIKIFAYNGCEHVIALTRHGDQASMNSPKQVEALSKKFVTTVGCSYYHTVFSCSDEMEIYACGRNDYGQLGLGHVDDRNIPTIIESLNGKKIVSIGCGQYHSVVATIEGEVYSFGRNDSGQLGLTVNENSIIVPKEVKGLKSTQIACGYYHSVGISNGQLYSWGKNDSGQLGLGNYTQREMVPTLVKDLQDQEIVQVACGCYHTLSLACKIYLVYKSRFWVIICVWKKQSWLAWRWNYKQFVQAPSDLRFGKNIYLYYSSQADKKVCQVAAGFYHSIVLANPVIRNPLVEDFRFLLNNQELSDVTFVVEGKKLHAHRCILMARCEPLDRMVNGPMREAYDLQIQIEDTTYQCFYSLLEYLYTEQVEALQQFDIDINFSLDLLSLADQYLVEPLKKKCEEAIQKSIKIDDVCLMLSIAMSRGANSLKKRCLSFIMSNFAKIIILDQFCELPKPVLKEVFRMASKRGVFVRDPL